ncbi:MAG: tetratricopeptide repeat protein [Gemmatimonadota bacterium]|nr:MAG: tetratricopeptide repeat protein [Gemmatimonadota bacterium]
MLTTAFLFFLLGLSADLYLLLRARLDPIQNWGDPGTWERLLDVVIGAEIRTRPTRYAAHTITELFTLLGKQFLLPGTALGAIGILSTIRRKKTVFVFFTLFFMGMALYILRNYDFLEDQYLPVFLVFSVWIGLGAHEILSFTASIRAANYSHMKAFIGPVISVLILSVPFSLLALNYTSVDKHDHRVAYNFGEKILEHLDEGAIFLSEGSNIPLLLDYFQRVEGRRTDVANVYLFLMEFDWYRVQLSQRFPNISVPILPDNIVLRLIEQNVKDRSVYYVPFSKEPNVDVGRLIPHGLFFRIEQKQTIPSRSELEEHFLFQGRFYSTLTRSLDQDSKDILAQLHGTMGLYFERIGMYDEAYKEYTKALEIDSLNPGVHYDLGSLAMGRGSFKEAIQDFQKVLEFEPSNVTTRYLLAQCYAHDGQLIPALREMEEVVRTEPHEPLFHTELGTLYGQMGRTELAIEQFRQALEYDPYNADILYNLGIAEALSDHLDMALQHLKQAEQQDTNRTEITYALASSYAQKRDFREAEYYYLRTLKLGGQQPSVLRDLGYLYAESGNAVKAIETWEAALALDPSNAQLQHELVRLRHRMRTDGKPD